MGLGLGFAAPASAQAPVPPKGADLKPISSGPGIQICEPVAAGKDGALADFGSGCGRWMQWAVGFHPELGQTPRWELAAQAARELHVPNLRLSLTQGARLVGMLGATHVAVGQINGTKAQCSLTYQIYAIPSQKAVGKPIKLSGSELQVIAGLPGAARTLVTLLGVHTPRVPVRVGATPEDLIEIGRYDVYEQHPVDARQKVDVLAQKLPIATLLSFINHNIDTLQSSGIKNNAGSRSSREAGALRLVGQASGNFLMLGAVATLFPTPSEALKRSIDSKVAAMAAPHNAVLAFWGIARAHTPPEAVKAAQRLVLMAPQSASAWKMLATKHLEYMHAVREGRAFSHLSAEDQVKLNEIYNNGLQAASQAAQLDPDDPEAWIRVTVAAKFASESERSYEAFWKAHDLNPNDPRIYQEGIDLYMPKWQGDREMLLKVVHLAMTANYPSNFYAYALGLSLQDAGFTAEAKTMFDRAFVQAQEMVRKDPNYAAGHGRLGTSLLDRQRYPEADAELNIAIQLDPELQGVHQQLAKLCKSQKRYPEEIAQLREVVRIASTLETKISLAEAIITDLPINQWEEAEKILRGVLKTEPDNVDANGDLGWVMINRKDYPAAIAFYRVAAKMQPGNGEPHQVMGKLYRLQSKFDDAIREGEMAVALSPDSYQATAELVETYTAIGDNDAAVKTYQRLIAIFPTAARTHFDLGTFYGKIGKRAEARAELQRALTLSVTPEGKKMIQEALDKTQ